LLTLFCVCDLIDQQLFGGFWKWKFLVELF
jgi:hypothetical protein